MMVDVDSHKPERVLRREASLCSLQDGITLQVFSQPHNIRQVAHLIIALQRINKSHKLKGTEFGDHELLNIMMENVIEECVVMDVDKTTEEICTFTNTNRVVECSVSDQYQKSLVLNKEAMILQAMWLQGGSFHHKVRLNLSTYVTPNFSDGQGQPVALGIVGTNFYLSCSSHQGTPVLHLEEVSNNAKLKIINSQAEMARFLFLKRGYGFSMTTFESFMHKGWYISTKGDQEPVDMCEKQDATRYMSFMVKQV